MVFLSVIVLGNKKGAVSSELGMFLVDALDRYYFLAPFNIGNYIWNGLYCRNNNSLLSNRKINYITCNNFMHLL